MSCSGLKRATSSVIMNLLSNDAQQLEQLIYRAGYTFSSLISLFIGIGLLWGLVGYQSLSGAVLLILCMICQSLMLNKYGELKYKQKQAVDNRLATVKDAISGIRAVKMYALEWKFSDAIKSLRSIEITLLRLQSVFIALPDSLLYCLAPLATLVSITTLLYSDVHLSIADIFTTVSVYNILCLDIVISFNLDIVEIMSTCVSMKRLEEFLLISKLDPRFHKASEDDTSQEKGKINNLRDIFNKIAQQKHSSKQFQRKGYSLLNNVDEDNEMICEDDGDEVQPVRITGASAGWLEDEDQCVLRDISLTTEPNQLLMVTGPVGSGKSTLLMALLREIPLKSGRIFIHGKIAYVAQHPWVFTGTVRDNILFGQDFDQKRYQKVLDVCDLNEDIGHFAKGDLSMIGQRGVRLSGGQRVRVSLARAVYSDADIYLLDDPLSALDVKVGQYVLDECICKELSNKIRILVTHQLQHLHRADTILIMKHGRAVAKGSLKQLINGGWVDDLSRDDSKSSIMEEDNEDKEKERWTSTVNTDNDMIEEDEDRFIGTVTWHVYWNYFRAALPSVLIGCFILFYLAVEVSILSANWWLSKIADLSHHQQKSITSLGILAILNVTGLVLSFTRNCFLYNILISASKNLHHKITVSVLKSPVIFFDTNPIGRIINRFSKDIGCMDDVLPINFSAAAIICSNTLGVVVLTVITNYWFVFVIILLSVLCWYISSYYMKTARDLKRMEAIQCSPIFAHVAETIAGIETVQTSHMQDTFLKKMFRLQDENTKASYLVILTSQWYGFHIDLLVTIFLTSIGGISLATSEDNALVALTLTLALGVLKSLNFALKNVADIECQMTSVERVLTYTNLPSEPGYNRHHQPPEDWPSNGALSMRNVSLVYFEGGPRVLKEISIDVKPTEKIGIAGRTGAGKSSLVASLFRMPDPEGHVLIDGVDLGSIPIQAARKSMAVITQDPVLFLGSLRKNLDPFNCQTDLQLWTALEEVNLKEKVQHLDGQLEYCIGEEGSGLSAGEKQLLCLARALLQRCKILVLDEATANIDFQTDQLIQQTIRHKFTNCTVLTVAHRINTIIDYDRVVVLDDGQVVEHDDPRVLAEKQNGIFASLLRNKHSSCV